MSQQLVAVNDGQSLQQYESQPQQLTARDVKAQVNLIQEVMQAVMQEGFHYGVIPGTEKPTLLKPGAEKLTVTFRLAPELFVETKELAGGHREVQVKCRLVHIVTGRVYGEGVGSCTTMESRYRYRNSARKCPSCGKETIIKGKAEYGGGWLCFQKKGGCGAKFSEQDQAIIGQPTGRVENEDIADVYNTVLKMAKKRALVDATLTATAASDIFTQDLEDFSPLAPSAALSSENQPREAQSSFQVPPPSDPDPTPLRAVKKAQSSGDPDRDKAMEGWQRLVRSCLKGAKIEEEDYLFYLLKVTGVEQEAELSPEQRDQVMTAIKGGEMAKWVQANTQ